jgi:hypothetical protein
MDFIFGSLQAYLDLNLKSSLKVVIFRGRNEIDIVAVDDLRKKLLFAEVKLQTGRFNPSALIQKSVKLLAQFPDYEPEYKVLSLTEM